MVRIMLRLSTYWPDKCPNDVWTPNEPCSSSRQPASTATLPPLASLEYALPIEYPGAAMIDHVAGGDGGVPSRAVGITSTASCSDLSSRSASTCDATVGVAGAAMNVGSRPSTAYT